MANKNISGDVNVEFTEAQSRQSLESGESVKTLFGKLRKWLTDLKPVAFSGSYNDLSYIPVNKAGDTMDGSLTFKDPNSNDGGIIDASYDDYFVIEAGTGKIILLEGPTEVDGYLQLDTVNRPSTSDNDECQALGFVVSSDDSDRIGRVVKLYKSDIVTLASVIAALGYTPVSGVKGDTETDYRTGNVNITAANIGAVRYDTSSQELTATQKSNARTNLGLGSAATYSYSSFATSTQGGYATDFNSNFKPIFATSGQSHASVFRGKYLGSSFTSAQKAAIADGSFDDLFVGDYWTIVGRNWRIADIDYINSTTHHLIIMPDTALYNTQFNTSSTSTSGYAGSNLYSGLSTALSTINSAFGSSYIMEHSALLTNAVSSGVPTGWSNYNVKVNIPTQSMLCGHRSQVYSGNDSRNDGCNFNQLNLFRVAKKYLSTVSGWTWTSDCVATAGAAAYNANNFNTLGVTNSYGVRPYFCLKGA